MLRKLLVLALIGLISNFAFAAKVSETGKKVTYKQDSVTEIKAKLAKIGTGEKAKVTIEMLDKSKIKGFVSKIDEDSFTVTASDFSTKTNISYDQVKKVSRRGLSIGSKVAIGVLIGAAVTVTAFFLRYYCNEQVC